MEIKAALISKTYSSDDIGNQIETAAEKEIYCTIESISQSEFFASGQTGLKPEYKLIMWRFEYNGAKNVKLQGKTYSIYRTYCNNDKIELYLSEKVGDK
jgi:SPP1 family predicted phage head-tail adaptor